MELQQSIDNFGADLPMMEEIFLKVTSSFILAIAVKLNNQGAV